MAAKKAAAKKVMPTSSKGSKLPVNVKKATGTQSSAAKHAGKSLSPGAKGMASKATAKGKSSGMNA